MEDIIQRVQAVLAAQPFNRLLGAVLEQVGSDSVTLRLNMRDELRQQHGFAHGAVLSYLADNALTIAGGIALQRPVLTAEFKINYLRPAQGEVLLARASALHAGRRQAVCRCEIYAMQSGEGKLVAVAQGTIAVVEELPHS